MTFLRWLLIALAVLLVVRIVRQVMQAAGPTLRGRRSRPEVGGPGAGRGPQGATGTPHQILGVEPGASDREIRDAYQQLIRQYHPDRVAHLAPELQQLAELRTKEINGAYQSVSARGGPRR